MKNTLAVADLGSNTFRLVTAKREGEGALRLVDLRQKVVRLAEGVGESGRVSGAALGRAGECLGEFRAFLESLGVEKRFAALTAVGRMARNAPEVIKMAENTLGAEVLVPSGEEEALLSFEGALSLCGPVGDDLLFLDIGGGSTEIVRSKGGAVVFNASVRVGIVTFWEGNGLGRERSARGLSKILNLAGAEAAKFPDPSQIGGGGARLIATAGTAMTLAALASNRSIEEGRALGGATVSRRAALSWLEKLYSLSLEERLSLPAIERGREELALGGIALLVKLMERYGFDHFTASDGGLAEGLLLRKFKELHSFSPVWASQVADAV